MNAVGNRSMLLFAALLSSATLNAGTLTLTPTGVADGFTLSTFATLNPGATGVGPLGVAVVPNGNVLVSNYPNNQRYVFADVDGQTTASALNHVISDSVAEAYATTPGGAYGGVSGRFVEFNNDGTVNHILTGVTPAPTQGVWGDPINGHIIASSTSGIIDIDPLAANGAGSFRVVAASGDGDGLSVSPDGLVVYSEQGSINGYDTTTGKLVFSSGNLFNSPDGTGVISSTNSLNGEIVVNTNAGQVDLLDPSTKTVTLIASGGTRGDYVSPDPTNGTLFLDYSESVFRLSCGPDCAIGSVVQPSTTPEPAPLALVVGGLVGLAALAYRQKAGQLRQ